MFVKQTFVNGLYFCLWCYGVKVITTSPNNLRNLVPQSLDPDSRQVKIFHSAC